MFFLELTSSLKGDFSCTSSSSHILKAIEISILSLSIIEIIVGNDKNVINKKTTKSMYAFIKHKDTFLQKTNVN